MPEAAGPTRWVRGTVVIVAALGLASCASGSAAKATTTTTPVPAGAAVLGADVATWRSVHPQTTVGGTTGYGSTVTVAGRPVPQFTRVVVRHGRVVGWHLSLPAGTHLAAAEALVRRQLPADVEQTASFRGTFAGGGRHCEFVNYRSAGLARALGLPPPSVSEATLGVILYEREPGQSGTPGIEVVNSADVSTTPGVTGRSC